MLNNRPVFYLFSAIFGFMIVFCLGSTAHAAREDSDKKKSDDNSRADIQNATCTGADLYFTTDPNSNECSFAGLDANEKLNKIISEVINFFSVIIGIIAVLMIIVGGFRYIISGGDSGNVTSAKNTILYAIIGLLIVVFAQFIVKFILSKAVDIAS